MRTAYIDERDKATANQQRWLEHVHGRVLEIGAAGGRNVALLPPETPYAGLEYDEEACLAAAQRGRQVHQADLDRVEVLAGLLSDQPIPDTIMAIDVLEHLRDPSATLQAFANAGTARAKWVIVVPNGVSIAVRWQVLRGRFPKNDSGIFDRTHLHFFDRHSLLTTVRIGLVDRRDMHLEPLPFEIGGGRLHKIPGGQVITKRLRKLLGRLAEHWPAMWAYEYLLVIEAAP